MTTTLPPPAPRSSAPGRSRPATWLLVAGLAVAGGIHLAVGVQHGPMTSHGGFFLALGAAQAALAVAVGRDAPEQLLRLAAALSAAVVIVWAATRAPGISTDAEAVGPLGPDRDDHRSRYRHRRPGAAAGWPPRRAAQAAQLARRRRGGPRRRPSHVHDLVPVRAPPSRPR
ncbi:MAG: hypothetical protein GEV08_23100 [Acidimicrobiia bacterium]|nr:hypothetical protein [Acidimicrobiia bacterium]